MLLSGVATRKSVVHLKCQSGSKGGDGLATLLSRLTQLTIQLIANKFILVGKFFRYISF